MKQGRSLSDVIVTLRDQNNAKRDFIAGTQDMHMSDDAETFSLSSGSRAESFSASDLFHRQLGNALCIPAKYYASMREKKPYLLAENVNEWLSDKGSSYMVRSFDYGNGNRVARALLSERYRRIDNMEIAAAVLPLFAGSDAFEVMSCEVTDSRLYLKIVNKRLEAEVQKGDIVQAGVMISNSEVGLGTVTVKPLLYRLVCTNGMIADIGERRRHVGRRVSAIDDSFDIYSDETVEAEDKAFMLKLRDVTMAAIDEAKFRYVVDRLKESAGIPITGKVQKVVELTGSSYGLSLEEQDGILKHLIEGGDLSKYGLSNAVTRASADIDSYDRATELEAVGWRVATMPKAQWDAVNSGAVIKAA